MKSHLPISSHLPIAIFLLTSLDQRPEESPDTKQLVFGRTNKNEHPRGRQCTNSNCTMVYNYCTSTFKGVTWLETLPRDLQTGHPFEGPGIIVLRDQQDMDAIRQGRGRTPGRAAPDSVRRGWATGTPRPGFSE